MGMPITSYTVLRTLALGGEVWERRAVVNALIPFSLFAFVLHDPVVHADFHRLLADQFDRLDYLTGEKLLFFALVDPPQEWLKHAQQRSYFQQISSWEAKALANPTSAQVSTDPELAPYAIARSINLDERSFPCIVVTDDFRSNEFTWLPTSESTLVGQLTELGYLAERQPRKIPIMIDEGPWATGSRFPRPAQIPEKGRQRSIRVSLALALSNVLSFIVVGSPKEGEETSQAKKQARNYLTSLFAWLDSVRLRDDEEYREDVEHPALSILEHLALLRHEVGLELQEFIPVKPEYLEPESYRILKTAHRVYRLLTDERYSDADDVLGDADDYSPGVISMAKVFEREINLSVVHWMRQQRGIHLPAYFDRHEPGVQAREGGTDLNASRRDGNWLPPELGKSKRAFAAMSQLSLPGTWLLQERDELLAHWNLIHGHRNRAAHDQVLDSDALTETLYSLSGLATQGFFERFWLMKQEYRSAS